MMSTGLLETRREGEKNKYNEKIVSSWLLTRSVSAGCRIAQCTAPVAVRDL
jgi:hypothetical protein